MDSLMSYHMRSKRGLARQLDKISDRQRQSEIQRERELRDINLDLQRYKKKTTADLDDILKGDIPSRIDQRRFSLPAIKGVSGNPTSYYTKSEIPEHFAETPSRSPRSKRRLSILASRASPESSPSPSPTHPSHSPSALSQLRRLSADSGLWPSPREVLEAGGYKLTRSFKSVKRRQYDGALFAEAKKTLTEVVGPPGDSGGLPSQFLAHIKQQQLQPLSFSPHEARLSGYTRGIPEQNSTSSSVVDFNSGKKSQTPKKLISASTTALIDNKRTATILTQYQNPWLASTLSKPATGFDDDAVDTSSNSAGRGVSAFTEEKRFTPEFSEDKPEDKSKDSHSARDKERRPTAGTETAGNAILPVGNSKQPPTPETPTVTALKTTVTTASITAAAVATTLTASPTTTTSSGKAPSISFPDLVLSLDASSKAAASKETSPKTTSTTTTTRTTTTISATTTTSTTNTTSPKSSTIPKAKPSKTTTFSETIVSTLPTSRNTTTTSSITTISVSPTAPSSTDKMPGYRRELLKGKLRPENSVDPSSKTTVFIHDDHTILRVLDDGTVKPEEDIIEDEEHSMFVSGNQRRRLSEPALGGHFLRELQDKAMAEMALSKSIKSNLPSDMVAEDEEAEAQEEADDKKQPVDIASLTLKDASVSQPAERREEDQADKRKSSVDITLPVKDSDKTSRTKGSTKASTTAKGKESFNALQNRRKSDGDVLRFAKVFKMKAERARSGKLKNEADRGVGDDMKGPLGEKDKVWEAVRRCRYIRGYDPPEMEVAADEDISEFVFGHRDPRCLAEDY